MDLGRGRGARQASALSPEFLEEFKIEKVGNVPDMNTKN
jgi:hypothetical protein